ncbi:MAG: bifunctional phosphoribosylaminoimidazolecarboxamide formyltransferase/IMP cyclohydrolase [Tissierellia bacterium]|nr:bifunctional phosphoribosylaminoimidazolecarboxamide formyltransferase/IMP cyclohydrolase [Tissierellia bacterium]
MKRALISVYDKTGVLDLAKELTAIGWEIVSTGGTYKLFNENAIPCTPIEDVTGFPEVLDGRVKTLHPRIHAGILYRRNLEAHVNTMKDLDLRSVDLIVNNLYPFEETLKKPGVTHEEIVENIDIGGPSMIRAAAKNYEDVYVVIDPADYGKVIEEIKKEKDDSSFRKYLAGKVFTLTAYYDSLIADYFNSINDVQFPEYYTAGFKYKQGMRYGENPHQNAAFYVGGDARGTISGAKQLHGKELSYNNINDTKGAIVALREFDAPTAVAVKHSNPCGIGSADEIYEAYEKAYACDPVSIFGGIVALNRSVDEKLASKLGEIFLEVIVAPDFTEKALEILQKKANVRILRLDVNENKDKLQMMSKKVGGGILVQEMDGELGIDSINIVTKTKPTDEDIKELEFAWKAAKHVASNGVCIVKNQGTIGIGQGEVNRVWAVENAIDRAGEEVKGAVLASDGFFPFKDSIEVLAKAGIKAIIQPGGSIRDEEVINCADDNGIAMIFTGMRHFRH